MTTSKLSDKTDIIKSLLRTSASIGIIGLSSELASLRKPKQQ
jgi:hypothetical protein